MNRRLALALVGVLATSSCSSDGDGGDDDGGSVVTDGRITSIDGPATVNDDSSAEGDG